MGRRCLQVIVVMAIALWISSGGLQTVDGFVPGLAPPDGFRVHPPGFSPGGWDAIVSGIVEVDMDAGCVWLSSPNGNRYPVVWPAGTTARSDPFEIRIRKGHQVVRSGDFVEGGGGYPQADSAPQRIGLEPFPNECLQGREAAVFNAGSLIDVTPGVGLELVEPT